MSDKYDQYQLLQEERVHIKQKVKDKWEEKREAARKGHTDLANQYTQETDAIVKTLKELDNQLEETAYEKNKASLELNRYNLGIYQGTEQKEGLEYRTGFFQERVKEYEEGERPFQQDTEQFIMSIKEEQEELIEELEKREKRKRNPHSFQVSSKNHQRNPR